MTNEFGKIVNWRSTKWELIFKNDLGICKLSYKIKTSWLTFTSYDVWPNMVRSYFDVGEKSHNYRYDPKFQLILRLQISNIVQFFFKEYATSKNSFLRLSILNV